MVCLIGPSGCGKSTLLRCINGLETIAAARSASHGDRVTGRGVDVDALRRDVGIVFQSFNLFPHMTVLRERDAGAAAGAAASDQARGGGHGDGAAEAHRARARRPRSIPTACRAASSSASPSCARSRWSRWLLLLDEITSALDPELVAEVLNIVRDLATEGMTMLLATHEMGFAREVASKVCFLYDGVVHEEGPPEQIFGDPERGAHPRFPQAHHRGGTSLT